MQCLHDQFTDMKSPFSQEYPFYVLIEIASKAGAVAEEGESGCSDLDRLFHLIEGAGELVKDGVVAQD